jgi:hypothetical protein
MADLQAVTDADYQAEVLEAGAVMVDFWGPS